MSKEVLSGNFESFNKYYIAYYKELLSYIFGYVRVNTLSVL
jgi:hypothetical protein